MTTQPTNPEAESSLPVRPAHWFIAAWPGMGNVAMLAAGYLIQRLGLESVGELPVDPRFDVGAVEVRNGLVSVPRPPRNMLFQSPPSAGKSDPSGSNAMPRLTVFVGESQPNIGSLAFAHELAMKARELGADRVVTFASMASQIEPTQSPRTFGAATTKELVDELLRLEVQPLAEGQIGGLNGVMLGAAAAQRLPATCLMAQIPFYAAGVPSPRAARAVLEAFSMMSGIRLSLDDLNPHIEAIDQVVTKMLKELIAKQGGEAPSDDDEEESTETQETDSGDARTKSPLDRLSEAARDRIEALFESARADRSAAAMLKRELDRLGVFPLYEDRFLDLFKRAE